MTIHHATQAKAAKLGIILTQLPDSDVIQAHWPEKNKRAFVSNSAGAPKLLDDMKLWKMITLEYPQLKVTQPDLKINEYGWFISLRGDVIGRALTLADAWQQALDVLEPASESDDEGEESGDDDTGEDNDTSEAGDIADEPEDEDESEGDKSVVKHKYKLAYKSFKQTCGDELSQLISKHVKTAKGDDGKPRIDRDKLIRFAKANSVWDAKYEMLNLGMARMNVANRLRTLVKKGYEVVWSK